MRVTAYQFADLHRQIRVDGRDIDKEAGVLGWNLGQISAVKYLIENSLDMLGLRKRRDYIVL